MTAAVEEHGVIKTQIVRIDQLAPDVDVVALAVAYLRQGKLVAFPTETVYGLAASVNEPTAVSALYAVKDRPIDRVFTVQTKSLADAWLLATELPPSALMLAERFLPGPLTLVVWAAEAAPSSIVSRSGKIGVRVPDSRVAIRILEALSTPLVVTSANLHGRPSPITGLEVQQQLDGRIHLLLDGGSCRIGRESTVLDLTLEPPVLLREGAIPCSAIEQCLGSLGRRLADRQEG